MWDQRIPLTIAACLSLFWGTAAQAQLGQEFPQEQRLHPLGLELAWWGQTVLDPNRDVLQYLTVDEQNVYAQSKTGFVSAFQAQGGQRLWSRLVGRPDQVGMPASSNNEQLLISVGSHIFGLDKNTGMIRWTLIIPNSPTAPPAIDEQRIYVGTVDGSVYTYDLQKTESLYQKHMLPKWHTRASLWRFRTPEAVVSSPVLTENLVLFASETGVVYSLAKSDKKLRFQFESGGRIATPIAEIGDSVFISDENLRCYQVDVATGRVKWVYSAGSTIRQAPKSVGNQLYLSPRREGLVTLSVASGLELWRNPYARDFVAATDTRVYARSAEGDLMVLDRQTGNSIGSLEIRRFSVFVANDRTDRIYLATPSGLVIALREAGSEYPVFHQHPELRPILPEFAEPAPTEDEATP